MPPRLKLNRDIALRNADPRVASVVEEILPNLDQAANEAVEKFRTEITKNIETFERTDYAGQLESAVETMEREMEEALEPLLKDIKNIADLHQKALDAWDDEHGDLEKFKERLDKARTAQQALETKVSSVKEKVRTAGRTGAKFVVGALKKAIFG